MTLTYNSRSSDFYTFYVDVPLSLRCIIRKVGAEDIAIRGNGTGLEYMCHFVYIFFNPVFQLSTAKNEINLFNNHILIVTPLTFAPAGAMTPSAEFLFQVLEPTAFLVHQVLAAIAEDAVAAHSSATDGACKNSSELCRRFSPVPQIIIFVFPPFTFSPFFSIASFNVKSLLTHSSSDSAMITRSSTCLPRGPQSGTLVIRLEAQ